MLGRWTSASARSRRRFIPPEYASHLPVGGVGEPDALEQLVWRGLRSPLRDRLQHRLQPQVVAAGEQRVERRLLERGADHGRAPSGPR